MHHSAKQIAENATFQAFINSYLREVDIGYWMESREWIEEQQVSIPLSGVAVAEIELSGQSVKFAVEVLYRSRTGRHIIGHALKYCSNRREWIHQDRLPMMITLIHEMHLMAKANGCHELASHFDELVLRMIESYQTMAAYIEARMNDEDSLYSEDCTFIEAEQSLLFGHWLHPTPKSRQGMTGWQQPSYAPELKGQFQLHYFQFDREMVKESSNDKETASQIILQSIKKSLPHLTVPEKECLIPMHPLQAQWLLQQDYVREAIEKGLIKDLGSMGPYYSATSSIRTVYNTEEEWMYKFSVPVKITNSLRKNRFHELRAGTAMAELIKKIRFTEEHPVFRMIDDPAYITAIFPGQKESGFEVILRSNPFQGKKQRGITSIAALVQDPLPGMRSRLRRTIERIALEESRNIQDVSMEWFRKYWKCAIEPLIRLYDEHGMALEAHQQNSVLDLSSGYPETYFYRDNQGYYLSNLHREKLCKLLPELEECQELFYEDALIQERFTYYLFMNQLFSVISRLGQDDLISEDRLIKWCRNQLSSLEKGLFGQGKGFIRHILQSEKLSYKANLLTRFHDVDELMAKNEQAVYTYLPNPFAAMKKEGNYAEAASAIV
ncbi:IucA/IucC family protein [Cytobacillus oceanisediminis]|uniref:IucA/IucC family protein n=1 Tax=Cytobacillus oceanisediminis TaxID=665099 RepID=UPI0020792CF0|nr:IucA/IucC family protein [Cytobacillus oceanisediminis]USK44803.1 siderophore biosynthesis protein [Cytobacillus oceanisediminis]